MTDRDRSMLPTGSGKPIPAAETAEIAPGVTRGDESPLTHQPFAALAGASTEAAVIVLVGPHGVVQHYLRKHPLPRGGYLEINHASDTYRLRGHFGPVKAVYLHDAGSALGAIALEDLNDMIRAINARYPAKPSPAELWRMAGGGTSAYSREGYWELMLAWGMIRPLEPGEKRQPLQCGWPDNTERGRS